MLKIGAEESEWALLIIQSKKSCFRFKGWPFIHCAD